MDHKVLEHLKRFAWMMDSSIKIPGIGVRFGIDSLIGLFPGGGDFVGGVLSLYIVWQAKKVGIPNEALLKMLFNIFLEFFIGSIPILGDIFDVAFKANIKNINIIEEHFKKEKSF